MESLGSRSFSIEYNLEHMGYLKRCISHSDYIDRTAHIDEESLGKTAYLVLRLRKDILESKANNREKNLMLRSLGHLVHCLPKVQAKKDS